MGTDGRQRPPAYDPEIHPQAAKPLCAKGVTIAELAAAFNVAISLIWEWKATHPGFFESCKGSGEDERSRRAQPI